MRIRGRVNARLLDADVARPNLAVTKEKPLVWGETVDGLRRRLALQGFLIGAIGDRQPAEVGDAFALDELAVFVQSWLPR